MRELWLTCCVILGACATGSEETRVRPVAWAQPVIGGDVDNWFRVSEDLFRCAQLNFLHPKQHVADAMSAVFPRVLFGPPETPVAKWLFENLVGVPPCADGLSLATYDTDDRREFLSCRSMNGSQNSNLPLVS